MSTYVHRGPNSLWKAPLSGVYQMFRGHFLGFSHRIKAGDNLFVNCDQVLSSLDVYLKGTLGHLVPVFAHVMGVKEFHQAIE